MVGLTEYLENSCHNVSKIVLVKLALMCRRVRFHKVATRVVRVVFQREGGRHSKCHVHNHMDRVSYSGGIYPRHEFDMGGIFPCINLRFIGNVFSGFENLILTLSVILRHLHVEAELSILRCLKLIRARGVIST
jgi:hypothetical protein